MTRAFVLGGLTLMSTAALAQNPPPGTYYPSQNTPGTYGTGGTQAPAYVAPSAPVNVLKYAGLTPPAMNGTENETPILSAIFGAAPAYSRIFIPPGGISLTATPTIGSLPKILQMSGNAYGTGSTIISNLEPDVLEETMSPGGTEAWYRTDSGTDYAGALTLQGVFGGTSSSNTPAGPSPLLGAFCFDPAPTSATSYQNSYVWCNQTYVHDDHIGAAQNVALATTMVRDPFTDGFGVRGPTWAFYAEATDNSGLPSNTGGPTVGAEMDLFANGEDPGSNGDYGDRDEIHMVLGRAYGAGLPARIGHGITIGTGDYGSATPSYAGRLIDFLGSQWDSAAIDTSLGHPLVTTLTTSAAQSAVSTSLTFAPYGAGVEVGMVASGTGIPTGDTVSAFNAATGSVTLATATTSVVASGASVAFTSLAPAIRIGAGQTVDFSGASTALLNYTASGGLAYKQSGTTLFAIGASNGVQAQLAGTATIGFDTTVGTFSGAAFRMTGAQAFCLDQFNAYCVGENGYSGFHVLYGGSNILNLDNNGNLGVVGTLSVSGVATFSSLIARSAQDGIVPATITAPASGSAPSGATPLTKHTNRVTGTCSSTQVLQLPAGAAAGTSYEVVLINDSGGACPVYPPSGGQINSAGTNVAANIGAGARAIFRSESATGWYQ